jgi:hypothetical protein
VFSALKLSVAAKLTGHEPVPPAVPPLLAFVEVFSVTSAMLCSWRRRTTVSATPGWLGAQPVMLMLGAVPAGAAGAAVAVVEVVEVVVVDVDGAVVVVVLAVLVPAAAPVADSDVRYVFFGSSSAISRISRS